jgi:hypothetical protein
MTYKKRPTKGTCVVCNGEVTRVKRGVIPKTCSPKCLLEYKRVRQINYLYKKKLSDGQSKKKCGICGRWFRKVGLHVWHTHGVTAREYREEMGLPVKKGILPEDAKEVMRNHFYANQGKVGKNLTVGGKKFRFVKGDPRTIDSGGWQHPGSGFLEKIDRRYY